MRSVDYRKEVGYVWRLWGVHIDIVRDRGSKGMDRCPLTFSHSMLMKQPVTLQSTMAWVHCLTAVFVTSISMSILSNINPGLEATGGMGDVVYNLFTLNVAYLRFY
jgi:hypothetical protein